MNYQEALAKLPDYEYLIGEKFRNPKKGEVCTVTNVIIAPAHDGTFGLFMILRGKDISGDKAIKQFEKEPMQIIGLYGKKDSSNIPSHYNINTIIELLVENPDQDDHS